MLLFIIIYPGKFDRVSLLLCEVIMVDIGDTVRFNIPGVSTPEGPYFKNDIWVVEDKQNIINLNPQEPECTKIQISVRHGYTGHSLKWVNVNHVDIIDVAELTFSEKMSAASSFTISNCLKGSSHHYTIEQPTISIETNRGH